MYAASGVRRFSCLVLRQNIALGGKMPRFLVLVLLLLGLGGCGKSAIGCSAADAQAPVVAVVKEKLEKQISARVRGDQARTISLSKIRAAIAQLVITIDDIRTSKEDPSSTKRFCTGTVRVRFPAAQLEDAEKAREAAGMSNVSDLAERGDVDRAADSFSTSLEFNIQPTDKGDKVFAEVESGTNILSFTTDVVAAGLLRAVVEGARREQEQAAAQQAAAENAALTEQRNANLNAARTENQLVVQTLTATWKAIPSDMRAQLLPLQRAWIRKKDADCRVEAASASTDPTEVETARLGCDTRASQDRIRFLSQYRGSEGIREEE